MLLTNRPNESVQEHFYQLLQASSSVSIASGYFGQKTIQQFSDLLITKAMKGGQVKLINGLGAWEGVSGNQEQLLKELDRNLQANSTESGVFYCTRQRYHGKIYRLQEGEHVSTIIGSSNYSPTGLETNLEANLLTQSVAVSNSTAEYIDYLMRGAVRPEKINLPRRGKSKSSLEIIKNKPKSRFKIASDILFKKPDFEIKIRCFPKSSLNLTFGAGRQSNGVFTMRPYYEVELTVQKKDWVPQLNKFIPREGVKPYLAITDEGDFFDVRYSPKNKLDERSGGDFMSSPREFLGEYIKGKLIKAGILKFVELVTTEMLDEYGTDSIKN